MEVGLLLYKLVKEAPGVKKEINRFKNNQTCKECVDRRPTEV